MARETRPELMPTAVPCGKHNFQFRGNKVRELVRPSDPRRNCRSFSRKLQNHEAAVALNYFAYNFIKIHRTLRASPAMAAGVTN